MDPNKFNGTDGNFFSLKIEDSGALRVIITFEAAKRKEVDAFTAFHALFSALFSLLLNTTIK